MLSHTVRSIPILLTAVLLLPATAGAQEEAKDPNEQVVMVTTKQSDLEIIEKFVKVVELNKKIKRVDGFDAEVINVVALSAKQIRVQALRQGVTTIVLTDEADQTFNVEVFVKGDARHLQAILNTKFPDAAVEAFKVRESVVLRGWVTQPDQITQIVEIAEQFYPQVLNQMQVGGEQQIMLRVKVMEVQRSKIRQMGMNLLYLNRNSYLTSTPGNIVTLSEVDVAPDTGPSIEFNPATLGNSTLSFAVVNSANIFQSFIEALKQESLLKILAEPELVATNGRPSSLLSGGEFPVLVPQSLGTTTIEWREFGVRLEAVPSVLGNGRLRLELQTEVSERDFTNAVELGGLLVPGLTTRRANTQVEMKFGETMMIAGLISHRKVADTDKVPLLGELPYLGAAFRRVRYDDSETELVVMVTPELTGAVDPMKLPPGGPGLLTADPTDRELFFKGLLEVPNYGGESLNLPGPITPGMFGDPHQHAAPGQGDVPPLPAPDSPAVDKNQTTGRFKAPELRMPRLWPRKKAATRPVRQVSHETPSARSFAPTRRIPERTSSPRSIRP